MEDYLSILKNISLKIKLNKGNILFFEGEKADNFFFVLSGKVRVYKNIDKNLSLHIFKKNDFIAEMPAFNNLNYPATAECESECEILSIKYKSFQELCMQDSRFNFLFIRSLFEKIKILENKLIQKSLNLKFKFVKYILENSEKLCIISQKQIALELDISAQSLSRIIKYFKSIDAINTKKGKIILLNKTKLKKMVGFDGF